MIFMLILFQYDTSFSNNFCGIIDQCFDRSKRARPHPPHLTGSYSIPVLRNFRVTNFYGFGTITQKIRLLDQNRLQIMILR